MTDVCYRCGGSDDLNHFDYNRVGEADVFCDHCSSCHKYDRDLRCDGCLERGEDDE